MTEVMLEVSDLDGDEVGLALVGDGLGKQGLATAWRSVEEDTLGWGHPKLEELFRELNRILRDVQCVRSVCVGGGGKEFPHQSLVTIFVVHGPN